MTQLDKAAIDRQLKTAFRLLEKGAFNEAHDVFSELVAQDVEDNDTRLRLGNLALHLDENLYAAGAFARLLEEQPDNAGLLYSLASASYKIGNRNKASELLGRAIELDPEKAEAYIMLGDIEISLGGYYRAIELLESAIRLKPSNPAAHYQAIVALRALNRYEEALVHAEKLLRLQNTAINHAAMSRVLIELGRQDEAVRHLEKAITMDKTCGIAYHDLASIKKFSSDDQKLVDRFEKALSLSMSAHQCSFIHFALGKIYDDCKQYEKAFEHYRLANSLVKEAVEPDYCSKQVRKIKKIYNKKLLRMAGQIGSDSKQPVFVVGMPRSGTTLIEQIVASHPRGAGAGELTDIQVISSRMVPEDTITHDAMVGRLSGDFVNEQVEAYLKTLCAGRESAARIVDKMPVNYVYLGLIHLLFPGATIIHAVRNPLDTCLSCYFQSLNSVPASYDFTWLANEYRLYRKTMDHWNSVLPPGRVVDVHYEQLTGNPEEQMRRLIESCGLEWDPVCLEFYKSKRAIGTASLWQARQPIYASSRKRWLNYVDHIDELANGLRDYLDDEDIADLRQHGIKLSRSWRPGFLR